MTYYYDNSLSHAEWKKHKYIRKEGNTYIYPEDLQNNKSSGSGGKIPVNHAVEAQKAREAALKRTAAAAQRGTYTLKDTKGNDVKVSKEFYEEFKSNGGGLVKAAETPKKSNNGYSKGSYYMKENGEMIAPSKEYYDEYTSNGRKLTLIGSRESAEKVSMARSGQTLAERNAGVAAEIRAGEDRGARIAKTQERIRANESGKATSGELKALTERTGTVAEQAQKAREAALANMKYNQHIAADKAVDQLYKDATMSKAEKVLDKVVSYFTDQTVTVKSLYDPKYSHTETYMNEAGIKKDARKVASTVKSAVSKGEAFLSKIFKK